MSNRYRFLLWTLAMFLSLHVKSIADDTDIYIDARPTSDAEPMIFLTLDYRSNLGSNLCTQVSPADPTSACGVLLGDAYDALDPTPGSVSLFDGIRAVFETLFAELDGVKVAFVLNHADTCTGQSNAGGPSVTGCSNGAYIVRGLNSFNAADSNNAKAAMMAALEALPEPGGNLAHSYQGKEMYFEIFRYLTGQAWHNAHLGWGDFGTNNSTNINTEYPAASWDTSIENGSRYVTPFTDSDAFTCSQAYAVNIMFQVTNQEGDNDAQIEATIANGGMGLGRNPTFNDVVDYMYDTDLAPDVSNGVWPVATGHQNLQSYFVAAQVNNTTNGYASSGGTIAAIPLTNPAVLLEDLRVIFQEILTVSTTFVAASVPVNVFNRSDMVDNVFLAQFAVDANRRPFWNGNLKKLKLLETVDALGSTSLTIVDADNQPAIGGDGRISYGALTYWTDAASLPAPADEFEQTGKDGRSVTRGGAGQRIPGYLTGTKTIGDDNAANTRMVFTEPASGTTLLNLGVTNAGVLQTDLGAASVADAQTLIRWIRGIDVDDTDVDGSTTDVRPWVLGAPLHSRPLPLNYGARSTGYTNTNPDIRIYMGSDDGFMHSIRNTTSAAAESGEEVWAFMPRSVMDHMDELRANSPLVDHPYTVDGAPAAYIVDTAGDGTIGKDAGGNADATDKAYLYFGLRRGGDRYYALNVTNPDSPSYLWKIEDTGNFSELGQTFSTPRVGSVKYGASATPVIIFGGGYDPDKDTGNANDNEGNAIYIVNAETGALVWKVTYGATTGSQSATVYHHSGMVDSIPSDVAAIDSNADGNIDRLYVGDTGGTVWRVDLPEGNTDNRTSWFASELANLGRDDITPVTSSNDRRFFHRPDFVPSSDNIGAFDGVLIGSGNREEPRETATDNYFYLIKDRNVVSGTVATTPFNHSDYHATDNTSGLGDVTNTCIDSTSCTANLTNGWKLQLEESGEKALAPALTAFGTVFFTSYLPEGSGAEGAECAPSEGGGRLYAVKIADGSPSVNYDASDGGGNTLTKTDRFNPLLSGGIPAEVVPLGDYILPPDLNPQSTGGRAFWKTFWYEKDVDSL